MSGSSLSPNISLQLLTDKCFRSETTIFVFIAFSIVNLLLLPIFIFIIFLACQKRGQRRTTSTTATSRSDFLTYHDVAMHLNGLLGIIVFFFGSYTDLPYAAWVGQNIILVTWNGRDMFHTLTCVEHYLAVVRPITYLHLKQVGEVMIRNISTGCVWLVSFGWVVVNHVGIYQLNVILILSAIVLSFTVVSFCSISVLCSLKHPGPEGEAANKERVDPSKQRAFYTVMAIMVAFFVRLVATLVSNLLYISAALGRSDICMVLLSVGWFSLPSNLVLPLLFLHRAGKLQCCK